MSIDAGRPALKGAILAAGRGTRMAAFGEPLPKCLMPIGNRPLIEFQIDIMRSLGIDEIVILIGHKGYEITKVLGDGSRLGVKLTYVEQTSIFGIAHAVGRLEPHIDRPFLLMLGDIFFLPGDLARMVEIFHAQGEGAVLAVKHEADPAAVRKNFSVTLSAEGLVTRVIEKPRYVHNPLKGVGLYIFGLSIFDAIRRTPRTAMRDEYELTESIQVMIDDGHPVRVSQSVIDDINLTYPTDLLRCNLMLAAKHPEHRLVDSSASVNPQARISESVIGANVRVQSPISIKRTLILSNSVVTTTSDLEDMVVAPHGVFDCRPQSVA